MYTNTSKNSPSHKDSSPSLRQPSSSVVPVQSQQQATASPPARSPSEPCSEESPVPSAVDVTTTDRYVSTHQHAVTPALPTQHATTTDRYVSTHQHAVTPALPTQHTTTTDRYVSTHQHAVTPALPTQHKHLTHN